VVGTLAAVVQRAAGRNQNWRSAPSLILLNTFVFEGRLHWICLRGSKRKKIRIMVWCFFETFGLRSSIAENYSHSYLVG
jgi:hypothetical protein